MADQISNSQAPPSCTEHLGTPEETNSTVQLEYPHLLLQTSLESLLTCSYQSNSSTITVKMPPLSEHEPLDESWASLDTEDFSHDYETHSESADNASLLDATTTEDEESVVEDDIESDMEPEDDYANTACRRPQDLRVQDCHRRPSTAEEENYLDNDTLVLLPINEQVNPLSIQLGMKRQFSIPPSKDGNSSKYNICNESLKMSVSRSKLDKTSQPFHVGYYGTASTTETKGQVLGKVGSALVVTLSAQGSSTYHIAPSEFDADLKPQSAELVPSEAQMFVEQVTIVKPNEDGLLSNSIDIAFKDGTIVRSKNLTTSNGLRMIWRPDLLLVHISSDDIRYDTLEVEKILELAKRHQIPTLMVADDLACVLPIHNTESLHRILEWDDSTGVTQHVQTAAIDLDQFIRLDSAQLNRHIKFLTDRSQEQLSSIHKTLTLADGLFQKIGLTRYVPSNQRPAIWIQEKKSWPGEIHEAEVKARSSQQGIIAHWTQNLRLQPLLEASAKSLLVALVLILVSSLLHYGTQVKDTNSNVHSANHTYKTTSQIANSEALAATRSTSYTSRNSPVTNTDLIQSDIFAYLLGPKPIQRFVADAVVAKSSETEPVKKLASDTPISDETPLVSKLHGVVEKARHDLQFKFGQARERLKGETLFPQRELLEKKREAMEKLQLEVNETLELISANVQMLSKRSRKHFQELVVKNQALLDRSREATGVQVRRIMKEQKQILATASKHARRLVRNARRAKVRWVNEGEF